MVAFTGYCDKHFTTILFYYDLKNSRQLYLSSAFQREAFPVLEPGHFDMTSRYFFFFCKPAQTNTRFFADFLIALHVDMGEV